MNSMTDQILLVNDTWISVPEGSHFPLYNIPFGIGSLNESAPFACTRIGDTVINLNVLEQSGFFSGTGIPAGIFEHPDLNPFIALGKPVWRSVRNRIIALFDASNPELASNRELHPAVLVPVENVKMHLPVKVGDYTDFYSSKEHATNVGMMFRDPANALLPNWKHLPVGYHGRSSSIVVSGTRIHRPKGQVKPADANIPEFCPTRQLDFELETAFISGVKTELGESVTTENAEDCIFGLVLFNDLSARDIQAWEYVPLGPFLAKNFGSVVSPWIVTTDALEPFRAEGPEQDVPVLPYLQFSGRKSFDIHLKVFIQPENQPPQQVCHSNFRYMYWNMAQQLAHQTVNGCNINVGDMYGSGTISGPTPDSFGSMLEITWKGTRPIKMADGTERKFIHDYDTIIFTGYCRKENLFLGFGEAITTILPAKI